jgi:hypothetical protein
MRGFWLSQPPGQAKAIGKGLAQAWLGFRPRPAFQKLSPRSWPGTRRCLHASKCYRTRSLPNHDGTEVTRDRSRGATTANSKPRSLLHDLSGFCPLQCPGCPTVTKEKYHTYTRGLHENGKWVKMSAQRLSVVLYFTLRLSDE